MLFRNSFQDLRYALRQLRRAPGFAFTVVLTLALSVGVATAVFCVIDAVILRPLPYANPERIVSMESRSRSGYIQPYSGPSYNDVRAQVKTFKAFAGYFRWRDVAMETPNGPVVLQAVHTTDNFFNVFGVQPILGRTFLPGEQDAGKNNLVVLSYEAWQSHFNGAADVVGKPADLDGQTYTIIGVMPAGFRFPLNVRDAVYTPLHLESASWMHERGSHWLRTVGQLRESVTIQQAQADLSLAFSNLGKAYATDAGRTIHVQALDQDVDSESKGPLYSLLGAVMAVLAVGCVNIAGLLLARGVKRRREMAMRVAVGAGRTRLLIQVLTEGMLLAVLGAGGGILLASLLLDLMRTFLVKALARGADIHMNWKVLTAAIAVAVLTSLLAALYPALRLSGVDPNRALKTGGTAGTERGQHLLRSGFVVTQVALTLMLLVVAGMLIRVVTRYRHTDLGFDPSHVLAVDLHIAPVRYNGRDVVSGFFQPLLDRVAKIPGVHAVGVIDMLPIEAWGSNFDVHIAGQPPYPSNQEMLAENRMVSTGYFDVMGVPLRAGRRLSPQLDNSANKAPSVAVNEAFVRKFLPGGFGPGTPHLDDNDKAEEKTAVIGAMGNVRQDIREPYLAEMDYLIDEIPIKDSPAALSSMVLVTRTDGDPERIVSALRNALHEVDPTVPLSDPRTMTEVVSEQLVLERMESWLFGIFASLALALALVGLYGLVSHEVEQGTRDIGVRMALGATRNRILGMVLRRVALMLAAGTVTGLVLIVFARKLIGMVIYFETQREAAGFLLLALLLMVAGMLAALIPAARAASVDPMRALRTE
jgi:putative ABC transport system permease protein